MIPFRIKPKVSGVARVTHRCYLCQSPINGDPILRHREDGQLIAAHADCHQKEVTTNGR